MGRRLDRLAGGHQVSSSGTWRRSPPTPTPIVGRPVADALGGVAAADMRAVEGEDRVRELARMLPVGRQRRRSGARAGAARRVAARD